MQQDGTEEERLRHIGIIQSRILSLKEMLEELFTYARLQDIDYQLELERIDFGKCVYNTVFSFYEEFEKKGIEPKADFSDGHFFIQGNEEALRRPAELIKKCAGPWAYGDLMRLFCEGGKVVFQCSNDTEMGRRSIWSRCSSVFTKQILPELTRLPVWDCPSQKGWWTDGRRDLRKA